MARVVVEYAVALDVEIDVDGASEDEVLERAQQIADAASPLTAITERLRSYDPRLIGGEVHVTDVRFAGS